MLAADVESDRIFVGGVTGDSSQRNLLHLDHCEHIASVRFDHAARSRQAHATRVREGNSAERHGEYVSFTPRMLEDTS